MKTYFNDKRPSVGHVHQSGNFIVEFALVITFFLITMFTVIEVSRALYIVNTLQEVTRRAARLGSVTDFSDKNAINSLVSKSIFRDNPGGLALAAPITDRHIKVDYLAVRPQTSGGLTWAAIPESSMPGCPAKNRQICTADATDPSCIRLVRVRVCKPSSDNECEPIPYETALPLVNLPMNLPISTSIVRAESLGYKPGMQPCN